ncbi:TetR/AcrR family transcriptional regulator [Bacillus sp. DX4.1]|uniref:TetR/AcrR family transcriptional regulator n=1 Tax=Bacillus sp. DX4.1 TaxID=3055867 RepID=UPI00259FF5E2|nr:TetR/AcrR family transcriptional regulator [Bacillus sp. DX4.1]MDM5187020.1 TetR/AcrR family transcriptional regulator [Bacillus sp. DX4.1]
MPKAFTEREKEIIRKDLLEKAKEFMSIYGINKTGIGDLTRAVGISKGAFYSFYNSKEELFLEVLEKFEKEFYDQLFEEGFQSDKTPKENFKEFFKKSLSIVETNPIMKRLNNEELKHFLRKLPEERIQNHSNRDFNLILQFVNKEKEKGHIKEYDSQAIAGVIRSIFFISLHREDFVKEAYPQTIDLLIDMVTSYLTQE